MALEVLNLAVAMALGQLKGSKAPCFKSDFICCREVVGNLDSCRISLFFSSLKVVARFSNLFESKTCRLVNSLWKDSKCRVFWFPSTTVGVLGIYPP